MRVPTRLATLGALLLALAACGDGADPAGVDPPPTANQPPVAAFTVDATGGPAPLGATFDASASVDPDGEIVSYEWEFGDGATGTGRIVTHVYASPGFFVPRLTVTDDRGATDSAVDSALVVTIAPGDGDGEISGLVWHDRDGDGARGANDTPVAGMIVYLDLAGNGRRDAGDPFTVTDRDGRYLFPGLETGRSYRVTQELGLGWTNTFADRMDGAGARGEPGAAGIIGGSPADEGEFPFMVALLFASVAQNQNAFTCGGTFLNSRWVLTAAHCVSGRNPSDLEVLVGTRSLTSGGERVPVRTIRVFPDFGQASFVGNDVAVMELDRAFMIPRIVLQTRVQPALSEPGRTATAIGWGRTAFGGSISTTLLRAPMQLISNGECQRMLGEEVVDSTICAGLLGTTQSTCQGDSGGPLMVPHDGGWAQVGVTSFGAHTCQPPIAFARVSEFFEWVESQVPREPSATVEVALGAAANARVDFGNFR